MCYNFIYLKKTILKIMKKIKLSGLTGIFVFVCAFAFGLLIISLLWKAPLHKEVSYESKIIVIYDRFVNFQNSQKFYLDNDFYYKLRNWRGNGFDTTCRFYLAIDRQNDSIFCFTFIRQKKGTDTRQLKAMFEMMWNNQKIGIITGMEDLFMPDTVISYNVYYPLCGEDDTNRYNALRLNKGFAPDSTIKFCSMQEAIDDTAKFTFFHYVRKKDRDGWQWLGGGEDCPPFENPKKYKSKKQITDKIYFLPPISYKRNRPLPK